METGAIVKLIENSYLRKEFFKLSTVTSGKDSNQLALHVGYLVTSRLVTCDPIKPAPPVIKMLEGTYFSVSFILVAAHVCEMSRQLMKTPKAAFDKSSLASQRLPCSK